jgi:DNA polymerase III sliding clamp (beta) subunit (PCNA family)
MNIKISNSTLSDILKMMISIAPSSSTTLPIHCVKIAAENNSLEITATNINETLVVKTSDATVIESGACLVDLRKLLRAIRYISGSVELAADDKTVFVNRAIQLSAASLEDYIVWSEFPTNETQQVSAESLCSAIQSVEHAASTDSARQVMMGVCFEWTDSGFGVAASDGFRIAAHNLPTSEIRCTEILPKEPACHLARWAQGTVEIRRKDDKYQNLYTWNHIGKGWQGHLSLAVNMITGKYPPFRKVIPSQLPVSFQIDRKALIQHMEALVELFKFDNRTPVRIVLLEGKILISVHGEEDVFNKIIPAETNGNLQFAVNPYLVLPALRSIKTSKVLFKLQVPNAPIVIEPVLDHETRIIMPMHGGDPLSESRIADLVSTIG